MKSWRDCLVKPDATIRDAVELLDRAALQIALLVDDDGVLLGTVTDGDIRRALLRSVDFGEPVGGIAHRAPTTVKQNAPRDEIAALMSSRGLHAIPVVDQKNRVVGVEFVEGVLGRPTLDNWVVLMAGGLGARLRPLTDRTPKPMLEVGGRPILETIVKRFADQGFSRFFISVNYERDQIIDHFGDGRALGVEIAYLEENTRLGTAGSLGSLPEPPAAPIFVMNGDLLTGVNFGQMLSFHRDCGVGATMAVRELSMQVPYGVVESDDEHRVMGIIEKPVHRVLVNAGIYVLEPALVAGVEPGVALDMPALLERAIADASGVRTFPLHEYWIDVGRMHDLQRAEKDYAEWSR